MTTGKKILVGLFVLGGFLLFGVGLFWIGDRRLLFSESLELWTGFYNLSGLKVGSKVQVSGMDAGEVLAIHVPPRPGVKFRVRFRILEKFRPILRTDSVASIQVEGLVGSKVLQVDAGSPEAQPVGPGATIPGREPLEIAAIAQQATDAIRKVSDVVDDVQKRVSGALDVFVDLGGQAKVAVTEISDDAQEILGTGKRVARDAEKLVAGVREGRGTVGKLMTDESLHENLRSTAEHVQTIAANTRTTSEDVRDLVADLRARNIGENLETSTANVRDATAQLKKVLAGFRSGGPDQPGLMAEVRETLENTREATADLAENMEALKRNFLFRGYFNRRGFYDLDALSREDYLQGKIAPDRARERTWLHAGDLFTTGPSGAEVLSKAGREKLDEAMAGYLRYSPNTLLIIEGYAAEGNESQQFVHSRDRAQAVRRYLVGRFSLKPSYVGIVPMGAVRSSGPSGEHWDGVALVFFPEKAKK